MKIDREEIVPILAHRSHAGKHLNACKSNARYLGKFLTWATTLNSWNAKTHTDWLSQHEKQNDYFPSYGFFLEDEMVAFASLGQGHDFLGRQIVYWVQQKYRGNGVAKEITEFLMQKTFDTYKCNYVEIHVDKDNLASQRIPESLGFKIVNSYECHPHGTEGSGHMNVWGLVNPNNEEGYTTETYPWQDQQYTEAAWSMTQSSLLAFDTAYQAIKLLGNGNPAPE